MSSPLDSRVSVTSNAVFWQMGPTPVPFCKPVCLENVAWLPCLYSTHDNGAAKLHLRVLHAEPMVGCGLGSGSRCETALISTPLLSSVLLRGAWLRCHKSSTRDAIVRAQASCSRGNRGRSGGSLAAQQRDPRCSRCARRDRYSSVSYQLWARQCAAQVNLPSAAAQRGAGQLCQRSLCATRQPQRQRRHQLRSIHLRASIAEARSISTRGRGQKAL